MVTSTYVILLVTLPKPKKMIKVSCLRLLMIK